MAGKCFGQPIRLRVLIRRFQQTGEKVKRLASFLQECLSEVVLRIEIEHNGNFGEPNSLHSVINKSQIVNKRSCLKRK